MIGCVVVLLLRANAAHGAIAHICEQKIHPLYHEPCKQYISKEMACYTAWGYCAPACMEHNRSVASKPPQAALWSQARAVELACTTKG